MTSNSWIYMDFGGLVKRKKNTANMHCWSVVDFDGLSRLKFPTMKSQGAAKNEANNAAQAGSAASAENVEVAAPAGDNNGFFTPNEKIDFSKVTIEPLFEEQVDFDTFSKSDFRAVKVKACEAVKIGRASCRERV